jgi:hypothetical protein
LARGDSFVDLRTRFALRTLEQKEVTIFVDVSAAEAKVPIDDPDGALEYQPGEPGLFDRFPESRLCRRFIALEMTLGKTPIVVGVTNQQIPRTFPRYSAKDNPPGTDLQLCTTLAH